MRNIVGPSLGALLQAKGRERAQPEAHARDGRALSPPSLQRGQADAYLADQGQRAQGEQEPYRTALLQGHGPQGRPSGKAHLPKVQGPQNVSVPAQEPDHRASQPGLGHRHYLYPHATGISLSGGHHRPAQPLRPELERVQFHGCPVVQGNIGRGHR